MDLCEYESEEHGVGTGSNTTLVSDTLQSIGLTESVVEGQRFGCRKKMCVSENGELEHGVVACVNAIIMSDVLYGIGLAESASALPCQRDDTLKIGTRLLVGAGMHTFGIKVNDLTRIEAARLGQVISTMRQTTSITPGKSSAPYAFVNVSGTQRDVNAVWSRL